MKLLAVVVFVAALGYVKTHGYIEDPIARTSIHLATQFPTQPPYWYDNYGVWCSNIQQFQISKFQTVEDVEKPQEIDASQGGQYDKGVIVKNYTAGSIIEIHARFQGAHRGGFQVELCPQQTETDNCFQVLPIVGGSEEVRNGNRLCIPFDHEKTTAIARVQLPSGVRCNRCTIRWTHRTSYPPAPDSCLNSANAQTFRNCADVAIL